MLKLLRGKKTKLILYTYDSFCLDFCDEEENLLDDIKNIFTKHKLNTSEVSGLNYGELN